MRRSVQHTLSHRMCAARRMCAHVVARLAGRVLAMSAYERKLPGRAEKSERPVRATRRLSCAENTSVIFAQTIAQNQTLNHRDQILQTPRSGFVGHIGMVGAVPCPEPETAQEATCLLPPASPPCEEPGRDEQQHRHPVRAVRRFEHEERMDLVIPAQTAAPKSTLAHRGRGWQTRNSGIVFGVGSAGLNQNAQRRQHQSTNARETHDQQPDHPAQFHGLTLGDKTWIDGNPGHLQERLPRGLDAVPGFPVCRGTGRGGQ